MSSDECDIHAPTLSPTARGVEAPRRSSRRVDRGGADGHRRTVRRDGQPARAPARYPEPGRRPCDRCPGGRDLSMAGGLAALLDDVAALARLAAASADDVAAASAKASSKAMGVVIDDAAVTQQYVKGLKPKRELPIIWRITKGSLRNKLVFILPALLLLSVFAPWALTPILMLGGLYLS